MIPSRVRPAMPMRAASAGRPQWEAATLPLRDGYRLSDSGRKRRNRCETMHASSANSDVVCGTPNSSEQGAQGQVHQITKYEIYFAATEEMQHACIGLQRSLRMRKASQAPSGTFSARVRLRTSVRRRSIVSSLATPPLPGVRGDAMWLPEAGARTGPGPPPS